MWLGVFAWMIDPGWMAWSSVPLPLWLRWTGVGVLLSGCGLFVWTFRCLGKNLTDTVVTRQAHTLVLHGPYRWVRHPFYLSAALLALAVSLMAANWFLLVTGTLLFCLLATRGSKNGTWLPASGTAIGRMERTGRFCRAFVEPETCRYAV